MSFDPTWLFLSLFPGGIGFVLLVYGRKQNRWPHIVAGLLFIYLLWKMLPNTSGRSLEELEEAFARGDFH